MRADLKLVIGGESMGGALYKKISTDGKLLSLREP